MQHSSFVGESGSLHILMTLLDWIRGKPSCIQAGDQIRTHHVLVVVGSAPSAPLPWGPEALVLEQGGCRPEGNIAE